MQAILPGPAEEGRRTRPSSFIISKEQLINNTTARMVRVDELSPQDILIALMGQTGSGKSTFIETATGMQGLVGHGLSTFTTEISIIRLSFPDDTHSSRICFIDTPGFDDTSGSDIEMFKKMSHWLNVTYKRNIPLVGLLYFHRISDNRMAGSLLKNLRLFEQICGKEFNRIVLVSTMWDQVDENTGLKREEELINIYWKVSISRGSSVARFQNTSVSAFEILMPILEARNNKKSTQLLLQKEMADNGWKLSQTTAGRTLFTDPENLINHHQPILQRMQEELKKPAIEHDLLLLLTQEHKELAAQLPVRQPKTRFWKVAFNNLIVWARRLRKEKRQKDVSTTDSGII